VEDRPGIYLDTNVLIDIVEALDGTWRPPVDMTRTDEQRLAAARLRFYGYEERSGWFLVSSRLARAEALARGGYDWVTGFIHLVDNSGDAPPERVIAAEADAIAVKAQLAPADARHLAEVILRPFISRLVTSDDRFRRRAQRLDFARPIEIVSLIDAVQALHIAPGERPPIGPVPGTPLSASEPWWIPES
jgi:predicted nucleic acid-binding protein